MAFADPKTILNLTGLESGMIIADFGSGSVPSLGRQTQGVRIMKLRDGDSLASLTCL